MSTVLPRPKKTPPRSREAELPYFNGSKAGSKPQDMSIEDLLREILGRIADRSCSANQSRDGVEAVLEVDIDCVRYTLVSSKPRLGFHLSPREKEIARLVAEGLPNKCIGEILEISTWTVATHLRRIFAKLSVNSRTAMIARLLEDRLLLENNGQMSARR
jgi:two-component system nitrate/nitrite response regulator NarL